MAITQIIPISTDGKISAVYKTGGEGGEPVISQVTQTAREEYRVTSNAASVNVADIYNEWLAAGGSDVGTWYPGADSVLKSLSFKRSGSDRQEGGPFVWHVTCDFAKPEDVQNQQKDCKISVSTETNDETDGRYDMSTPPELNINSAGDFFEDKLPLKNKLLIFRYSLNYFDNPNKDLMGVYLCTNTAAWHGLPAGSCLVRNISTDRQKKSEKEGGGDIFFWATNIEIAYNPNGWKYKKADCGFYTLDGRILDDQGAPVESAKLLNGSGYINTSGTPVYREFQLYGTADFAQMNLPCPFEDNTTPCPTADPVI